ncbi:MAG: hypothetical protein ACK4E0_18630 [Chitinophagaceae bacterium]
MNRILNLIILSTGICISVSCQNQSASKETAADQASTSAGTESDQAKATSMDRNEPSGNDYPESNLIPISLLEERFEKMPPVSFGANNDTVALVRLQYDRQSKPSLQLSVERVPDAGRLGRMLQTWSYHPDFKESFPAGDEAALVFTRERASHYYTVVFRVNNYFASIVSDIDAGSAADNGILFSDTALKQLAIDWADHLKKL